DSAPPTRLAAQTAPCARPRSALGNQRAIAPEAFGYAPASPAPNRNCVTINCTYPVAAAVAAVNADHHTTIRVSTRRWPTRSPEAPDGISNIPYASAKAPRTQPHLSGGM